MKDDISKGIDRNLCKARMLRVHSNSRRKVQRKSLQNPEDGPLLCTGLYESDLCSSIVHVQAVADRPVLDIAMENDPLLVKV